MDTDVDPLTACAAILRAAGDPAPRITVIRMAAHIAGGSENDWMIGRCPPLSTEQAIQLEAMCLKRAEGVPLQYLLREAWFLESVFRVGPGVLVPRPDTEILVLEALSRLRAMDFGTRSVRFADACTGSGCVGLSVAAALDRSGTAYHGLLTDCSEDAMRYARENLHRLNPAGRIDLVLCDLFPASTDPFDLIIANPPYIPTAVIPSLMTEVALHEPGIALDGGEDGLAILRRLVSESKTRLTPGGWLLVEHGFDQGEAVRGLFLKGSEFDKVESVRDFGGNERVTAGRMIDGRSESAGILREDCRDGHRI